MKYIFMDLDGTLTNPKLGITTSIQYSLNHFGIKVDNLEVLTKYIGPPLKEAFMADFGFDEQQSDQALARYRERYDQIGWLENEVYDGIEEALIRLKASGRQLIVATSKPEPMAVKILEHFHLAKYFTSICGASYDGKRAKKEDVIRYAIERNQGIVHEEVLMVGDRNYDIIGAKQVGLKSMGVLYGFGSIEELQAAGADYIATTVLEMCVKCLNID